MDGVRRGAGSARGHRGIRTDAGLGTPAARAAERLRPPGARRSPGGLQGCCGSLEAALNVVRYKTAKYTVERPLQLGAALAGGDTRVLGACSAYGIPLGEAFQLRDDVLGLFGDPAVTGKSRLDDLREGKHTPLLAIALRRADPAQVRTLRRLVGDPGLDEDGAARVRGVLESTGALDTVERMIVERHRQAVDSLERSPFPPSARAALHRIAAAATVRTS
ncbi:polyprenyl synthetase family protein [Streptomyces radiopugnans]|uniref:polyprenyl synthetase family protein n=1 Tax=Streptomyces radiopugnans TaxID=403935 RepID=UPI003F1DB625